MAIAEDADATDEPGTVTDEPGTVTDEPGTVTDEEAPSAAGYTRKDCVLITGCSSGIGRATARAFLAEDWRVVATARDPADVADLADAGCETAALDVTKPGQVADVVEETIDRAGSLDCVVNNAGYAQLGPAEDVSTRDVHRQFDVNVYGPHRLVRAALPHMRAQGEGTIVNVSSVYGRLSTPAAGAYAGSKHALEAMSDALRSEVEAFGIDVVLIEPGTVRTGFEERVREELPGTGRTPAYEDLYELIDDVRLIGSGDSPFASEPEEVAAAILESASTTNPPVRYPVGPIAQYGLYARLLPDRLRDAAYGLVRKLA